MAVAQPASRAGRLVFERSLVWIPALPGWVELHVKVSLSKILNPKLLLMCSWHPAWQPPPSVYECVCEWVNVASTITCFEKWKKPYTNASPFKENVLLRTFSRTLRYNVQAKLSLNILRRLSENIFRMFLENVNLEHSGTFRTRYLGRL